MIDTVKPNGGSWKIREQIVRCEALGLTIQFELTPLGPVFRVVGDEVGGLEIGFTDEGLVSYHESGPACAANPTWISLAR